jgi:hypothetical protein
VDVVVEELREALRTGEPFEPRAASTDQTLEGRQ